MNADEIEKMLIESNDALRSAMQIAMRDGAKTNWSAWRQTLADLLQRQHAMTNALRELHQ